MARRDTMTAGEHPSAHGKTSARNLSDLRRHYEVERSLADRLRAAPAAERRALYGQIYNELFARVPDHPQLSRKVSPERSRQKFLAEFRLLRKFITRDTAFLEIGAGDAALSQHVARHVREVTAIDVSDTILKDIAAPSNMRLLVFDGCEIPVPPASIDVVYSNQVIEHLHPEDAALQITSVLRALKPGGCYLCVTPNRLNGPHDISQFFDTVATGLHMKEYTYRDIDAFFRRMGYTDTRACIGIKGHFAALPVWTVGVLEGALSLLPTRMRIAIARTPLLEKLLIIRFLARRPVS
ncbi:MAG TPA: class I SAM-dependent methyltransferase [Candidatus Krumholzibacteria bacterium]|nr:class I SAM-dependent methyltransferase [Candidatus Krumholzibacteria bacterium]